MKTTAVDALRAADIPPERRGRARTARLSEPERGYYIWILRQFARATPPTAEAMRTGAARFGLDPDEARVVFADEDLVHTDAEGRPLVAYPFSATARGHSVLIDGKQTVQAMCALDALGIAPMLGLPIEIVSSDPISGGEIRVQVSVGNGATWQPAEAVARRLSVLQPAELLWLLRCAEFLRDDEERDPLPARAWGGRRLGDLDPGRCQRGPRRLRRRAQGELMPTGINRTRVQELIDEGAQLVEVLPAEEYEDEHFPGAHLATGRVAAREHRLRAGLRLRRGQGRLGLVRATARRSTRQRDAGRCAHPGRRSHLQSRRALSEVCERVRNSGWDTCAAQKANARRRLAAASL